MKILKLIPAIFLMFSAVGCNSNDDDTNNDNNIVDYKYLDATSYTDWVYFSFENAGILEITDFQNDLSWDIAFHRGDIRLNGGESGKGQGAAINTGSTNWNAIVSAPVSGYISDKTGTITTAFTGQDIETEEQPFSQTLGAWITIDTSTPPPVYTYHDLIFVVKSATGKYVKLLVYDYKNAKNAGAYISFKYQMSNEDGSFGEQK